MVNTSFKINLKEMQIGELSKLSGFSRDTIRYYEKTGLIKLGRKHRLVNNYKDYPEAVLKKLLTLKKLKGFGFTLNESSEIIAMIEENQASCSNVSAKVNEKVTIINEKIEELMQVKNMLVNGVILCLNGNPPSNDGNCTMLIT
jgi:DNA-binding transcriptional MerR regulator